MYKAPSRRPKKIKDVKCGALDPHPPHAWGIYSSLFCNGEGLRK